MRLNAKQIAECTGGTFLVDPIDPRTLMTGITWDSREIRPGWLFVALPGERHDGHEFLPQVLRAGAAGALVSAPPDAACALLAREMGAAIIEVPDTAHALTDLARFWRGHLKGRVIGLTGSTGKTTTKNLIRDVLSVRFSTVATAGNQNNELGVPRTLLAADPETAAVVVEMGMRGAGQIASLCDFVRPDWGVITNIGESHIELLGSREAIACAKAELLEALPAGTGKAVLNGDDGFAAFLEERADLRRRFVSCVVCGGKRDGSVAADARVWAEDLVLDGEGRPRFMLCCEGFAQLEGSIQRRLCALGLRGRHNAANALEAAAVGLAMGLSLEETVRGLQSSLPESGRQEVLTARVGFTVINDAYNANPDSMRASLSTFCAMDVRGRRIAVLGDMGELGDYAEACHRGVGAAAAALPLDQLICIGDMARLIASGAREAGMDPARIMEAASIADVLGELDSMLDPEDAVLVKASHFMGLNRVVEGLVS